MENYDCEGAMRCVSQQCVTDLWVTDKPVGPGLAVLTRDEDVPDSSLVVMGNAIYFLIDDPTFASINSLSLAGDSQSVVAGSKGCLASRSTQATLIGRKHQASGQPTAGSKNSRYPIER